MLRRSPLRWRCLACATAICALWAGLIFPQPAIAQAEPEELFGLFSESRASRGLDDRALIAIQRREYVAARELATQMLGEDPLSIAGHTTLGLVLHQADGSLPRALYHLTRAREIFDDQFGEQSFGTPAIWHRMALRESARVAGAMGNHELKLAILAELERRYREPVAADRGWPLMRLRRYEEARATALDALTLDVQRYSEQHTRAYNALCAIEGEMQHRMQTYLACNQSLAFDKANGVSEPVAFTNAAIGALGVLRIDEAERLMLDGTEYFQEGTASNPWMDLTLLLLAQARLPEALSALREMIAWRQAQPPYMDEQSRAQTDVAAALFLVVAGRPVDGARLTRRALSQPDRTGYTSSETEQMESAAALVHQLACRAAAEALSEQASWSPFPESLSLRWDALKLRASAWSAGRRAASLLAHERILLSTVRPYLPGSAEVAEFVQLDLPALLGPGVVEAAVAEARRIEDLEDAEGYFDAFDTEIAWRKGDTQGALEAGNRARATLPRAESMLRARVSAIAGASAWSEGEPERAIQLLAESMQIDPGTLRQLRIALPVRVGVGGGPIAVRAAELLSASPRLAPGAGLTLQISVTDVASACLLEPQGNRIGCAEIPLPEDAADRTDQLARELAAAFHTEVFAPRLDLTQLDISSLDGSPTAGGGRGAEALRNLLDDIVGPTDARPRGH